MERKITLSQAAKQFNVGVNTIVEFLIKKGFKIDNNPKTRLTNELFELLDRTFDNSLFVSKSVPTEITIRKDKPLNILGHIELSEIADNNKSTRKHHIISQPTVKIIGIVKFYDHYKDFGFIVTNGCDLSFIKETGNGLYDFYINSKSCFNSAPNSNDWVIFDCENKRATDVRILDYNKETLSLALKYRGDFAKIIGQDIHHSEKVYNHSVLSNIVKNYDNNKTAEIIEVFCHFLSEMSKENIDSSIIQFTKDQDLVRSLLPKIYNKDYSFDNSTLNQIFQQFKKYLSDAMFEIVKDNTDLFFSLPLSYLKERLTETEIVNIIKNKFQTSCQQDFTDSKFIGLFKELFNDTINENDRIVNAALAQLPENESVKTRFFLYKNNCINILDENFIIYCQDKFTIDEIIKYILLVNFKEEQKQKIAVSYMRYLYINKDVSSMLMIKNTAKDCFTDKYIHFETEWTSILSDVEKYRLWTDEREVIEQDYSNYLFDNLLNDELEDYNILFRIKRLNEQRIIEGLINNLRKVTIVDSLPLFNKVYNHIITLIKLETLLPILDLNNPVYDVFLWHLDKIDKFDFATLRTKFIYFNPSDQVRIVKKLFMFAETQKMPLTIEMLDSLVRVDRNLFEIIAKEKPDIPIDISVDVVIKSLSKYAKEHKFFYNNEIFDIMLMNMKWSKKYDFRIDDFFDECTGRVDCRESISSIPYVTGKISTKNNNYEITIYSNREIGQQNGFFNRIKDEIKGKLHYSKWNAELKVWQAPIEDCNTTEIKRIAQTYNMQIEGDNEVKTQQTNAINSEYEYVKFPNPSNVTFCEGRLNETKWNNGKPFYWCRNLKCFKNAIVNHTSAEWEQYTMFDFLRILGINTDNVDKNQYLVLNGDYIVFVSIINRINELLEHLKCKTCGELLEPVEITDYASQLVTHFKCTNLNYNYDKCPEYGNVYYIHNCFNWKCRSIIDQRETTKCPNGWYICKECGSCCSTSNAEYMIKKQQERNRNTPSKTLLNFVKNNLGHVEKNEIYCFKCGNLTENYYCSKCKFKYDSRKLFNISHL